jgi:hypothetical protein
MAEKYKASCMLQGRICDMSKQLHFTMGQLLEDIARRYPDNDALVYPDRDCDIPTRNSMPFVIVWPKGCWPWE